MVSSRLASKSSQEPALVGFSSEQQRLIAAAMQLNDLRSMLRERLGLQALVEKAAAAMEAAHEVFGISIFNRQRRPGDRLKASALAGAPGSSAGLTGT